MAVVVRIIMVSTSSVYLLLSDRCVVLACTNIKCELAEEEENPIVVVNGRKSTNSSSRSLVVVGRAQVKSLRQVLRWHTTAV